jgi:hypothetical protein
MKLLKFSFLILSTSIFGELACNMDEGSTAGSKTDQSVIKLCHAKRLNDDAIRILFVGNSLTYSNNLPSLVERMGNADGRTIRTEVLAYANYALADHWNDQKVQQLICAGDFDFVVVQQGPSSQADGREMLFDFGERMKRLCDSRGTELAFFMVWPAKENYHTFEGVIKNYRDAASVTKALLCPVGEEFKKHGDRGDDGFYSADNFHPSPAGSQRAAEIIYSTLLK